LLGLAGGSFAAAEPEFEPEVLDMTPDDGPVSWSMRNVAAPFTSIFYGGLGYWYKERRIEIETTPPGGVVDLFYVRSGFQKRFEQAETPVTVILPPRIEAGSRDVLKIRAFSEGYRQREVVVPLKSRDEQHVIDLEPLPNLLTGLSSRYFAGRASVGFLTTEALTHRVQASEGGFAVILVETGMGDEVEESLAGENNPLVAGLYGQQLGEDLMVTVELTELAGSGATEPRTRASHDAARGLHYFSIDLVPVDGGAEAVARAQKALPRLTSADVTGCNLVFEGALREKLDAGDLNRALSPHGSFAGPYLRAAMRRLGEVSPEGQVEFSDGSRYRPSVPIELEMALTQAGSATGYLALLRRFAVAVEGDEYARQTFRSLVAPEMNAARFGALMDVAERREQECLDQR
jgi:hypothetical protein